MFKINTVIFNAVCNLLKKLSLSDRCSILLNTYLNLLPIFKLGCFHNIIYNNEGLLYILLIETSLLLNM